MTPRFPETTLPTDAGPGDYISSDFDCRGPAYSLPGRTRKSSAVPNSPGPGQYIRVQLSTGHKGNNAAEGFGKRESRRFDAGKILVGTRSIDAYRVNHEPLGQKKYHASSPSSVVEK